MAAKKAVKRAKPKSKSSLKSKSSGKLKDLMVKRATAVKGGMYRRKGITDPCAGEE